MSILQPGDKMSLRAKAEEFAEEHGGYPMGDIQLGAGAVCIKVAINDRMFHIYYSRRWYYDPDGISIPAVCLEQGLRENATIVMYVINECVWQYASEWLRLSSTIHNSRNNTDERLIKKEDLLRGTFAQKPKGIDSTMDGFM